MDLKKEIIKLLKKEIKNLDDNLLQSPPNQEMGDYTLPCFTLSKQLKKDPKVIAEDLTKKLKPNKYIKKIQNIGPYLNFFVNKELKNKSILEKINKKYGTKTSLKKTIVIEFPSPNTNKPLHLGHLRNMALGDSISRILETQGYKIKRVNLNNDRGIHICKSMLAYKKWSRNKKPNKKTDHFVGDYYVLFAQKEKENKELNKEAQQMLRKWEKGDPNTLALWKKMNKWAFDGFNETYKRYGIKFTKEYYESKIFKKGRNIILDAYEKKIVQKDKTGAILINLGKKLGEKILLRSDSTSVYITQDIYLAKKKYDDYKFTKSIYVVGREQEYHFEVLFNILKLLKFNFAKDCYHLSYGMVSLPHGKMKSREGTVVDADNLMDDLSTLAKEEIKLRHNLNKKDLEDLSEKIGIGAIKYYLLKFSAQKDFTFNPEESISFEGETGPYIQYSLVRAKKIIKKLKTKTTNVDYSLLKKPEEITLINLFSEYPLILEKSAKIYKPHIIADYAYKLASNFNRFYEFCPVVQAQDKNLQIARKRVVEAYIIIISSAINLLGIEAVDLM